MQYDEHQARVVGLRKGLHAVIGVAGCGKTRSLVGLVEGLIRDGADPASIVAMTFTRAAAAEMNERLAKLGITEARIGTIHSVCREVLANHTKLLEAVRFDEKGQLAGVAKKAMSDMSRKGRLPRRGLDKDMMTRFISLCKGRGCGIVHQDPFVFNESLQPGLFDFCRSMFNETGVEASDLGAFYAEVERRRFDRGLFDYDDMLLWAWLALVTYPEVLAGLRAKWRIIIVDEAQDSCPVQWDTARLIAGLESCILKSGYDTYHLWEQEMDPERCPSALIDPNMLVAFFDTAQSIYRWRAAVPEMMVQYTREPNVEKHVLPVNYRSTPGICKAGSSIVRGKPWHLSGDMVPGGQYKDLGLGETLPTLEVYKTPEEEANKAVEWCVDVATELGGVPNGLKETAILSRTTVGLHLAEIEAIRKRIPYRKLAGGSFFSAKEIKDILAYLRVVCHMDPTGAHLRRAVNAPFRYISSAFLDECFDQKDVHPLDTMADRADSLHPKPRRALHDFINLISDLSYDVADYEQRVLEGTEIEAHEGPEALIAKMLHKTDYIYELRAESGAGEDDARILGIRELQRVATMFRSPREFLAYCDQLSEAVKDAGKAGLRKGGTSNKPALTLATLHSAKGLEWYGVRIIDCADGRFPHPRNADQDEELRLFYVGVTRAKRRCVVSCSGKPSPYIAVLKGVKP